MVDSILTSTKKALGIVEQDESFDAEIIMHINGVFSTLNQLGIGPALGFSIEDKTAVWSAFLGSDELMNAAKSYVYLRVRLLFDPPTVSFVLTAFQEQIKEIEWRLNVQRETVAWVDPTPPPCDSPEVWRDRVVFDGGIG